ncbi:alpha/beta hydrolase [Marixanthomonas spongiae]|uniref:Alpha/beta hydrolase n=1 Tax=Marixanthomonas spongiae TaxID=2174845 RepID=A0A2U0HW65_9FLAO|nr:alpha/beta hydrolase [Marixanthomonas spongiae]PVW13076.1 alpha/beta hydrolase [Marixanthomonas spongiae]
MNKSFPSIVILTLSLFFIACSEDNKPPIVIEQPLAEVTQLDVSYGENPQQTYDLYLPGGRSSEKTKVIILIHGGGWIQGDKSSMEVYVPLLKEKHPNHAIVNLNYVLAQVPTVPAFPNQFLDLGRAINKLTRESESLQIAPEFGLIGVSAGAHIALQYDYVYDTEDQVKMVCDIVGPTDFTDPFYTENANFQFLLNALVDETAYPENSNIAQLISPALQVTESSSPTLLFYGNEDPLVPLTNGETLQENLSSNGITHSFIVYTGGHGNWDEASNLDLQLQLTSFINDHLPVAE